MLQLTEKAKNKIKALIADKNAHFRVALSAGGCKGLSVDYSIDEKIPGKFDLIDELLVVDKKTAIVLKEATLDWETSLMGNQFVMNFADKKQKCSCGKSIEL